MHNPTPTPTPTHAEHASRAGLARPCSAWDVFLLSGNGLQCGNCLFVIASPYSSRPLTPTPTLSPIPEEN